MAPKTQARSREVKFCLVPADASQPVQELTFSETPGDIGGFVQHINALYARDGAKVDVEVFRQQVEVQAQKSGGAPPAVSSDMLNKLALSQTVDIVHIMPALPANGWVGVYMYVDDKGIPKNLEKNRRASEFTAACGIPTEVRGDAYISRLCDDQEDKFERLDFLTNEMTADAPWLKDARRYNEERTQRGPPQYPDAWKGGASKPAAPPADADECLSAASDLRAKGTAAFKAGDFASAAGHYKQAADELNKIGDQPARKAEVDKERLPLHLNLASAYLHLEQPYDAIKACDLAVEIDSNSVKGWYRRGQACIKIRQYAAARRNLHRAAELEPQNREIRQELERCTHEYREQLEAAAAAARDEADASVSGTPMDS
jgi:hypothetical protein